MQREQIIDILKNGFEMYAGELNQFPLGKKFVSFGQLPEEIQKVAREIGKENFECMQTPWGNFLLVNSHDFVNGNTYRLRADYSEPKKEEYEYFEIIESGECYTVLAKHRMFSGIYASTAHSVIGFVGYAKEISLKTDFQQTFTPDMKYVVVKKA